jgi:hypothetical protein
MAEIREEDWLVKWMPRPLIAREADPPDFTKLTPEAIRSSRDINNGHRWKND